MKNERYYYGIMAVEERQVYKMVYQGLKARAFNIAVSSFLSPNQVQDIYLKVLYDSPLFYYINQTVVRMAGGPGYYILLPEYLYSNREITLINQDIRNLVNKVCVNARRVSNNEFRLEKYLHDSVVKSVAYDYDSLKKTDCFNAHSIVGAFLDRKAVCEGIAKAFKLLCNECELKCIVVLGKADPAGVFGEDTYHAWNLVKIGNDSYHVDPTWDNMYDKGFEHISYDYFNLTTAEVLLDHRPMGKLPECTSSRLNYFSCTNSNVSTYDELIDLINTRFDNKAIMFKIRPRPDEFRNIEEIQVKTHLALYKTMFSRGVQRKFAILFNEPHLIGKILFL